MYEQINSQLLSMSKNFTNAAVKFQSLSLEGLERIAELQMKTLENNMNATTALFSQVGEVRDMEGIKSIYTQSMNVAKDSAAKLYSTSQEVMSVTQRTNEALADVVKDSFEATNESVVTQTKKAAK